MDEEGGGEFTHSQSFLFFSFFFFDHRHMRQYKVTSSSRILLQNLRKGDLPITTCTSKNQVEFAPFQTNVKTVRTE